MRESQNLRISESQKIVEYAEKYTDLKVFQKAFEVSIDIHQQTQKFPKTEQYGGLADQMRRSSKSICANIAEGFSKQQGSKADFRRFILIALGSAHETKVWIQYCLRLNYIDQETFDTWSRGYDEIARMLQSFYTKI